MSKNKNFETKGAEANGISPFDYEYYPEEGISKKDVNISEETKAQIERIKSKPIKLNIIDLLMDAA